MTATRRSSPGSWILALLLAAAAAGCSGDSAEQGSLELATSRVERRDIESTVEATGTLEPLKVVEVKSQASGEILNMPVELGDRVERGDLLLEINPRDEENELQQARADLEQARARLEVAEEQLERARVLRDSGVVTAGELESAKLEHANARSTHVKARTRLELARERRADATVRAPITGTIIERQVEEGQVITSTNSVTGGTTLLRMADLDTLRVRTMVDESDVGQLERGLRAEIIVEAYPDSTFRGQVQKIEPQATVEQNVTMFPVLIRIPNEEGLLRPGMNADVEIVVGREEGVLALPNPGIKMPAEARRLVDALGMDPALLEREPPRPGGSESAAPAAGEEAGGPRDTSGLPSPSQLRSMSREERRELIRSLGPEERRRLMARMRGGVASRARSRRPGRPQKAFVFVWSEEGKLTVKPVTVGLSSLEYTEVASGLAEGDSVVEVPLALVQQREMLQRFRRRSGVPGMGGS